MMTSSQKIARAFEIFGYILLTPSILATLWSTIMIFFAPWFTLLVYAVFIFGCVLLAGYFKHSRGRLDEARVRSLWIATAVFNAVLSLPYFFYAFSFFDSLNSQFEFREQMLKGFFFTLCVIFVYLTTIILAVKAYRLEKNLNLR